MACKNPGRQFMRIHGCEMLHGVPNH